MSKKMIKKTILLSILFLSLSFGTALAVEYVTLESGLWKEAGLGDGKIISTTNLGDFLSIVFNFGIAIAVALSVIMITVGGIQYMTTDSWMKKEDGKGRIKNAFYGLALALVSWLILYTINPDLVNFSKNEVVSPGSNPSSTSIKK